MEKEKVDVSLVGEGVEIEASEEVETVTSFDDMQLKEELIKGIYAYGFDRPSKIQ
jgi:ATP-dependent RNA helicase